MTPALSASNRAFTLVELSIVLVILGLLVGGVLSGQSLIRAAELRSVVTQRDQFVTATHTFRDKYFGLPGDLANATDFWGQIAAGAACFGSGGTGTQTCNGNGDGRIVSSTNSQEHFHYWRQLANAGLIEGQYSGVATGNTATPQNTPTGKLTSALWFMYYYGTLSGQPYAFDGTYNNVLMVGGQTSADVPANPIFKPEDAYNIDRKTDDGKPALGKQVVRIAVFADCTTATTSSQTNADYLLTSTTPGCSIYFRDLF